MSLRTWRREASLPSGPTRCVSEPPTTLMVTARPKACCERARVLQGLPSVGPRLRAGARLATTPRAVLRAAALPKNPWVLHAAWRTQLMGTPSDVTERAAWSSGTWRGGPELQSRGRPRTPSRVALGASFANLRVDHLVSGMIAPSHLLTDHLFAHYANGGDRFGVRHGLAEAGPAARQHARPREEKGSCHGLSIRWVHGHCQSGPYRPRRPVHAAGSP